MPPQQPRQRAEQQRARDTRTKILDAAVECLVEVGYKDTTTVLIQQRAGVSRGSLLHHFGCRESLLVAASQHLARVRMREVAESYAHDVGHHRRDTDRVTRCVEVMWEMFHQPYFWAAVQLWVAARTDQTLRELVAPQERSLGKIIHTILDELFGADLAAHPNYAELIELLFTSMRGVALTYAIDPGDPWDDAHLPMWRRTALRLLDLA